MERLKELLSSPFSWGMIVLLNLFNFILSYAANDRLFIAIDAFLFGVSLAIFVRRLDEHEAD